MANRSSRRRRHLPRRPSAPGSSAGGWSTHWQSLCSGWVRLTSYAHRGRTVGVIWPGRSAAARGGITVAGIARLCPVSLAGLLVLGACTGGGRPAETASAPVCSAATPASRAAPTGVRPLGADVWVEYPAWSPDGTKLAFMGQTPEGSENYEIYVVNADGTGLRRLTRSPGPDGWPAWSPDRRQILFASVRDDCAYSHAAGCKTTGDIGPYHTLYVMHADGSHQARVSDVFGQIADWAPDGRYIVFEGRDGLSIIRADGSDLTMLVTRAHPPALASRYAEHRGCTARLLGADPAAESL